MDGWMDGCSLNHTRPLTCMYRNKLLEFAPWDVTCAREHSAFTHQSQNQHKLLDPAQSRQLDHRAEVPQINATKLLLHHVSSTPIMQAFVYRRPRLAARGAQRIEHHVHAGEVQRLQCLHVWICVSGTDAGGVRDR